MKFWAKIIVAFVLFLGNCVNAEPYKVLVLPVDLFAVCENYYCFPEASEIFANDVIEDFNKDKKIIAPNIYEVRKKIAENPDLKSSATLALSKFRNTNSIDFSALKKLSKDFNANSVILISSSVIQNNSKRSLWEVLEIATAFEIYKNFNLKTYVILTDNINDIVMWSGKFERNLGNNETCFWAKNMALADSTLEKIKAYSQNIISKNITQNITLRFYPKNITTNLDTKKTETKDFRPNALEGINTKLPKENDYGDIQSETIFNF